MPSLFVRINFKFILIFPDITARIRKVRCNLKSKNQFASIRSLPK